MLLSYLDRYAAWNVNFVLVVTPHSGPSRAERGQETLATSEGLRGLSRGGALGWLRTFYDSDGSRRTAVIFRIVARRRMIA